ncbi:hypothetical protein ACJ72_03420 [Emergomyces africanus]|uniref:Uncharacterized protein n=1 Tax=Emergomyces africanus TaxID=1955775 RepID=A0A1B7P028_9EURO|nr:hypothetical protein ACJ72_03420 [Emergomyces africanus]
MVLSIKHRLHRWTVQRLQRIGFTNVIISTPRPTWGDGSPVDIDDDYNVRSSQSGEQRDHSSTQAHANSLEKGVPIYAYSRFERTGFDARGPCDGLDALEG